MHAVAVPGVAPLRARGQVDAALAAPVHGDRRHQQVGAEQELVRHRGGARVVREAEEQRAHRRDAALGGHLHLGEHVGAQPLAQDDGGADVAVGVAADVPRLVCWRGGEWRNRPENTQVRLRERVAASQVSPRFPKSTSITSPGFVSRRITGRTGNGKCRWM